jgi:hypothetical protein
MSTVLITVPGLPSLEVFQCSSHCSLYDLYFLKKFLLKTGGRGSEEIWAGVLPDFGG